MKIEFNSSMLNSADYDSAEKTLTVEFANGDEYKYKDVPEEIFIELQSAQSAGKFFLSKIRNNYKYDKL